MAKPTEGTPAPLPVSNVRVWCARLDRYSAPAMAQFEENCSPDERERAASYRFPHDARRFIVRRGLLRRILADLLDAVPAELIFRRAERGKLELSGALAGSQLCFNMSHSHELALIAVSRGQPVGVDVEWLRPIDELDTIAKRYLRPADAERLRLADPSERVELFYRGWTRLEAELKAMGVGLGRPGDIAKNEYLARDITPAPGYVGALAVKGDNWVFEIREDPAGEATVPR